MSKPKKTAMSGEDKKEMDAVLRRMLAMPPKPTVTPVKTSGRPKKADKAGK